MRKKEEKVTESKGNSSYEKLQSQVDQSETFIEYSNWEWQEMLENETLQWPSSWYRPAMSDEMSKWMGEGYIKPNKPICFQNVNVSYKMIDHFKDIIPRDLPNGISGKERILYNQEPEIRICGTNERGNSVCARVRGFFPYFRVGMRYMMEEQSTDTRFIQKIKNMKSVIEREAKARMEEYLTMNDQDKEKWRIASMHSRLHLDILNCLENTLVSNLNVVESYKIKKLEYYSWIAVMRRWLNIIRELKDRFLGLCMEETKDTMEDLDVECPHLKAIRNQRFKVRYLPFSTVEDPILENFLEKSRGVFFTFIGENKPVEKKKKKKSKSSSKKNEKDQDKNVGEEEKDEVDSMYCDCIHRILDFKEYRDRLKRPERINYYKVDIHCTLCKQSLSYLECIRLSLMRIQCHYKNSSEYDFINGDHHFIIEEMLCGCKSFGENNVLHHISFFQDMMESFLSDTINNILNPLETFQDIYENNISRMVQYEGEEEEEQNDHQMKYVRKVELEDRKHTHFVGYQGPKEISNMFTLRIELFRPSDCSSLRSAIQYSGLLQAIELFCNETINPKSIYEDDYTCDVIDFIQTYESDVPFVLRFCNDRLIKGMGWVTIKENSWEPIPIQHKERISKCQIEVIVEDPLKIEGDNKRKEMAPLRCLGFDCEMASANTDYFVCASNVGDILTQISCVVYEQGKFKDPIELCVFCLGGCDPLLRRSNESEEITEKERIWYSKARVYSFGCERELLLAFRRFFEINSFDLVFGYNSKAFDLVWLTRRANNTLALGSGMPQIFGKLGKFIERRIVSEHDGKERWTGLIKMSKESFKSNQMGTREYECVKIPGIDQFDVMLAVMSNRKMRSYNLNSVGEELAKMAKIQLDHIGITSHSTSSLDVHRSVVTRYCIWDTLLTMIVGVEKETYDVTFTEMARCTGVPLNELLTKGQTVKVYSQLIGYLKELREGKIQSEFTKEPLSFIIPYMRKCPININPSIFDNSYMLEGINDDLQDLYGLFYRGDFKGGYVFTPKRGYYTDIIFCDDFASLYPNIIISFNLCYTTYIPNKEKALRMGLRKAWDFRPIEEGGDGEMPQDASDPGGDFWIFEGGHCFVRRHILEGVLPRLLSIVLEKREEMKTELKKHDYGSSGWLCFNAAQLAFKITANSVYGFTGAPKLAARFIASTVTFIGRYLIQQSNKMSIEYGKRHPEYQNTNIYGDTDSHMNLFTNLKPDKYSEKRLQEIRKSEENGQQETTQWEYDDYSFEALLKAAHMGDKIGKVVTENFQRQGFFSINMRFEKIFRSAVFLMPKKYAVYKYEFDGKTNKLTPRLNSSGLETVRRDTTELLQDVFAEVQKLVLEKMDLEGAISYAQKEMLKLKDGQVNLKKLVITGNFSKRADQYVNPVPHIEAVKRAEQIDAMMAPRVGQRISYVVVRRKEEKNGVKLNVFEKTELYRIALMKKMEPDTEHYMEKCIDALSRFFAACLAPNMSQEEGQSYVTKTVFYDFLYPSEKKRKLNESPILKSFAIQKKRQLNKQGISKSENQLLKEMVKDLTAGDDSSSSSFSSSENPNEKNQYKTSHKSFKDFLISSGMDSKGRRMKKKRRKDNRS